MLGERNSKTRNCETPARHQILPLIGNRVGRGKPVEAESQLAAGSGSGTLLLVAVALW